MSETAFLVFPSAPASAPDDADPRSIRLAQLADANSVIDRQLRERLADFEVDYMAGVGGWTVRTGRTLTLAELRTRLDGLPVNVADESSFSTL
jgi:hypothetical protein